MAHSKTPLSTKDALGELAVINICFDLAPNERCLPTNKGVSLGPYIQVDDPTTDRVDQEVVHMRDCALPKFAMKVQFFVARNFGSGIRYTFVCTPYKGDQEA